MRLSARATLRLGLFCLVILNLLTHGAGAQDEVNLRKLHFPGAVQALPACSNAGQQTLTIGKHNGGVQQPNRQCRPAGLKQIATLPLSFEPNRGQSDPSVKFVSHVGSGTLFLTQDDAVLVLSEAGKPTTRDRQQSQSRLPHQQSVVRMSLIAANPALSITGADELPGKVNYYLGNDSSAWLTGISLYRQVIVHNAYPHVDLIYHGDQGRLEYDFVLAPGVNSKSIQIGFKGVDAIQVDAEGNLVLQIAGQRLLQPKPVAYQEIEGNRRPVEARYTLDRERRVGFQVASYNRQAALVIDPWFSFSGYVGGSGEDSATAIAVDSAGNTYLTGSTNSTNFPIRSSAQPVLGGFFDGFITKFSGTNLIYSTYLGGADYDSAAGVAVDSAGNAYVAGSTLSKNFPTTPNASQAVSGGGFDAFVTKFGATGSILYSTYLGGSANDLAQAIAVDSVGDAYVTGWTASDNFPTTPRAFQLMRAQNEDVFISELDTSGSVLLASTYLGGVGRDQASGITLDGSSNVYLVGTTTSPDFPLINAVQNSFGGGGSDAFAATLDSGLSTLNFSTYLGGSGDDFGVSTTLTSDGGFVVAGVTGSRDFPITNAWQGTFGGGVYDGFVTKIDPLGATTVWSTFFGGTGDDEALGIAADTADNIAIVGYTNSTNLPLQNQLQNSYGGGLYDAFVAQISGDGASLVFSTYLGGIGDDRAFGTAVDTQGTVYVAGSTDSPNFPRINSFQEAPGGGRDAFAAGITRPSCSDPTQNFCDPCTEACVTLVRQQCDSACPNVTLESSGTGCKVHCIP